MTIDCPRCHETCDVRFYGPCAECSQQLRDDADRRYVGWAVVKFLAGDLIELKEAS